MAFGKPKCHLYALVFLCIRVNLKGSQIYTHTYIFHSLEQWLLRQADNFLTTSWMSELREARPNSHWLPSLIRKV